MSLVKLGSNACIIALLMVMALESSSHAFSQEVKLLEEPKAVSGKTDMLYRISRFSLRGGTVFDMATTVHALRHPTIASRPDGSVLMNYHFVETEMPGNILGNRNAFGIVAKNVAFDFGIALLSDRLHRRGGKLAWIGTMLNFAQAANRVRAGFSNARINASVNESVRDATGWQGRIFWSDKPMR